MAFVRGYFKIPGPIIGKATEPKRFCIQSCKHALSPLPSAYKTTKVVPQVHPPSLTDSKRKYPNIQMTYYCFCKAFLTSTATSPYLHALSSHSIPWRTFNKEELGATQRWGGINLQNVTRGEGTTHCHRLKLCLEFISCFFQ